MVLNKLKFAGKKKLGLAEVSLLKWDSMSIIIASRLFLPEPGAAALRLGGLAKAFAQRNLPVTVLTSTYQKQDVQLPGVNIKRAPVLRDKLGAVRGYVQYMSFDIPLFVRLLAERKTQTVICEPPPTTGVVTRLACALKRVPYVYFAGDILTDAVKDSGAPEFVVNTVEKLERFALRGAALVITVTPGVEKRALEFGAKQTIMVPNGVDTSAYEGDIPENFPTGKKVLLYAGTASAVHGAGIFIEAFQKVYDAHPDTELVYLGQGTDWPKLQEMAAQTSLPIKFFPLVPNEVAKGWFKHSAVGLVSLPNNNYSYAYATKCLASLAHGTPVAYVGGGQTKEDIETHNLGVVAEFTADDVSEKIISLLDDIENHTAPASEALINWVETNRSLTTSSAKIADSIISMLLKN
ncbi:hypothetical protein HMPREF0044_0811 [Gleimia coleocanis DSM 15436]|uniref:Glycosyltransferase subfamily 4-like N-terminal domain-containing protein n=2 Tax=Gleimia TaxID=2692113 RepID=C0VZT3_9ACTO|nr:hypothetical protein HMPREF0044_0811 [Gleimia coleocanis DSM 15436]